MLHYKPQHVSCSTVLIFRRSNCKRPYSTLVESELSPLSTGILYGRLQRVTTPGAVIVHIDLLKMSIVLLKTY